VLVGGGAPYGVVFSPDGWRICVTDEVFGWAMAFEATTGKLLGAATVGARPALLTWISKTSRILVANASERHDFDR